MYTPQSFLWCNLALIEPPREEMKAPGRSGSFNFQEKLFFSGGFGFLHVHNLCTCCQN